MIRRSAEAAQRYRAGENCVQLAKAFGVHYTTILAWLDRENCPRRKHSETGGPVMTPAVKRRVDELADTGLSGAEIARQLRVSKTLVYRHRSFAKKPKTPVKELGTNQALALRQLLENLRRFIATERGAQQHKTIRPQIEALEVVLS